MENRQSFKTEETDKNKRLDAFLQEKFEGESRSKLTGLIKQNLVLIDGTPPQKSGQKLKAGQRVEITFPEAKPLEAKPENLPLEIVYEDDDLAVINKPQGMVVHAGAGNKDKTLVNALLYHIKNLSGINGVLRPGIVHRLDKNTAGLLVVAKNDFAHKILAKQIEEKTCHRQYLALLEGNVKEDCGIIETNISRHKKNRKIMSVCPETEGKKAITEFKVLERFPHYCLTQFNLKTGRTHQIRVHSKDVLNCPIAGDIEYGGHNPKILHKSDPKSLGQYLFAQKLEFTHPKTNKLMSFEIPLPDFFEVIIKRLKV